MELSCDIGEAATPDEQQVEDSLWPLIDAANVACGGHAGDERSMRHAVVQAKRFGVILGAHPSYPDRPNFGRVSMKISEEALRDALLRQLRALTEIARAEGLRVDRVKPHGALYNDLHHDSRLGAVLIEAIRVVDPDAALVAAPSSATRELATSRGMRVIGEAFADRRYRSDGSLVSRGEADALLLDPDEAAAQAERIANQHSVIPNDGNAIPIEASTLCIHGDMADCVARLQRIRKALGR
ncbi:MAG TPA: 5-oxoprolinase subunit PxpA [Thermoanaerobaculia bacterium]|nr:5-oxoprolinase subunit PxpA [Thermoanaerobaculia bacterium]